MLEAPKPWQKESGSPNVAQMNAAHLFGCKVVLGKFCNKVNDSLGKE
jgi:hypothetical protein